MSEEEYVKIIEYLDNKVILAQEVNRPLNKDEDYLLKLSCYCDDLRSNVIDLVRYLEDKIKIIHKIPICEVTNIDLVEEAYKEILDKVKGSDSNE